MAPRPRPRAEICSREMTAAPARGRPHLLQATGADGALAVGLEEIGAHGRLADLDLRALAGLAAEGLVVGLGPDGAALQLEDPLAVAAAIGPIGDAGEAVDLLRLLGPFEHGQAGHVEAEGLAANRLGLFAVDHHDVALLLGAGQGAHSGVVAD